MLPSDVIIALRFVFDSARSDKMQQQSKVVLRISRRIYIALLSTASA